MKRLLVSLALLAAACGAPSSPPDGASLALNLHFEQPHYRASAASVTDPSQYRPTSLRLMVCNNFALTETVRVFCRFDAGDFNYAQTLPIPEGSNSGTLTFTDVPPADNQIVVVQGMVGELMTYQGYATMPTIEPRGVYSADVKLGQIYFPPLPAPAKPVITQPSSSPVTAAPSTNTLVIKGTRELNTTMRATFDPNQFGIGSPKYFDGNSTDGYYNEHPSGNQIVWDLTLTIPQPRTTLQTFKISFAAARKGDTLFSQDAVLLLRACGTDVPSC